MTQSPTLKKGPSVLTIRFLLRMVAVFAFFVFFVAITNAGEKRWIAPNGAKLKAEKSASSETIAMLTGGAEVAVISSEKRWFQVSESSGKTGWVYGGKLLNDPPGDTDPDAELIGDLVDSGIALDASDTARSIRGKSKSPTHFGQGALKTGTEKKYRDALETVMSFYVGDREIDEFLKAGKIGEYAQ